MHMAPTHTLSLHVPVGSLKDDQKLDKRSVTPVICWMSLSVFPMDDKIPNCIVAIMKIALIKIGQNKYFVFLLTFSVISHLMKFKLEQQSLKKLGLLGI